MKSVRVFIAIILMLVGLATVSFFSLTAWQCAFVMAFHFMCVLGLVWKNSNLTPFFLFMATFVFLFIGGRFWVTLVDPNFDVLTRGNFFDWRPFTPKEWKYTLKCILLFIYLAGIGYMLIHSKQKDVKVERPTLPDRTSFPNFLSAVLIVLGISIAITTLPRLVTAIHGGGYLSLYLGSQNSAAEAGSGIWNALLWVFFGIVMVYGNKNQRLVAIALISFKLLIFAFIGQRGALGCLFLFYIWYILKERQVKITSLIFVGIVGLIVIGISSALSIRGEGNTGELGVVLKRFLFAQGVSLSTFVDSTRVDAYPTLAYWSSIFPGVGSLASIFSETPIFASDYNFSHYLAYSLNREQYISGHGLGWTLMSDFYVFSHGKLFFYSLFSLIFGLVCGAVERGCYSSTICQIIVYTSFVNFVFLPRAGLDSILPMIVWIMIIFGVVQLYFKLPLRLKKKTEK